MTEEEEKLHKHIEKLEEKIRDYEKRDEKLKGLFNKFLLFLFKIFIGKGLKDAFYKLFSDLREKKNITTETLSELAAAIVRRFTRIGLLSLIVVATPIVFAILQYCLLYNQNKLIAQQNTRIEQQTYLVEAQRRSALVFLMGNIFEEVNNELKGKKGKERQLSPQLIGRIIALSHSLTPYKFLVGDNLTDREYSPERGQLLITLVNSDIDSASLETIYFNANFTQSYLENVTFKEKNLKYCDLSKSNLKRANLQYADLTFTKLIDATLIGTDFSYAKLYRTDFYDANLRSAFLLYANFNDPNLIGALIDEKIIVNMDDINKYRKCFYDTDTKTGAKIYQLSQVDCSDAPNKKQKEFLKNYHSEY